MYTDGIIESTNEKDVWTEGTQKMLDACIKVKNKFIQQAPEKIVDILSKNFSFIEDHIVVLGLEV